MQYQSNDDITDNIVIEIYNEGLTLGCFLFFWSDNDGGGRSGGGGALVAELSLWPNWP